MPSPKPKPQPAAKPAPVALPAKPPAPAPAIAVAPKKAPPTIVLPPPAQAPAATSASTSMPGIGGHLQVIAGTGQAIDPAEVAEAVVYFVPDGGAPHPKAGQFQIFTRDKQFDPTSTVVPLGSTINFPNKDELLHNVFSVSPGAEFDLGLYAEGKSAAYTFAKPGVVTVNCNVHPMMQVSVLVLDTPFFTHPSRAGEFQLSGLPAGPGKLVVWHPRAGMQTFPLLSSATSGLALQITLSKPRVAPHLNKERKPYLTAGIGK
ncbi:MAG: hypothetical protein ABI846_01440 [Rudaea sp.]